jgi:hypothetical protein
MAEMGVVGRYAGPGARTDSPVGYLVDVRGQLTPRTVTARIRRILKETYGPPIRRIRST